MPDSLQQDPVDEQTLRILRIVVGAMVGGCALFLVVVLVIGRQMEPIDFDGHPLLTYVGVGFALAALTARMVIPAMLVAHGRQRIAKATTDEPEQTGVRGELWALFRAKTILGGAIVEGVTFFMLIAHMLERSPLSLILALLLIAGLALHMPTRSGAIHWIEDQLALIEQERQFRV